MPTYVCSVRPGRWTPEQKQKIAQAIAVNHSAATGAPPNLVHVVIQDSEGTTRYVGGQPEEEHIWIMGYIRSGRTKEEIGRLLMGIVRSVSAVTGMDEHYIWTYICPIESEHMAKYGSIHPVPGKEKDWFASMPEHVKEYMARNTPPPEAAALVDSGFTGE